MDAARKRWTEIQVYGPRGNNKTKASEACDSETSDIDIVDDEPQDGMVIEEYTLSVNNCDKINEESTDDEETDESVLDENMWDSSSAVEGGDL